MLTRSGLGAVLVAVILAVLGLWWNYEELVVVALGTTIVVLVTCVVFGVYLWFVDIVMGRVLTWLYAVVG